MAIFVTIFVTMIKMAFNDIKCISGHIFATINSIIKHEASDSSQSLGNNDKSQDN